MIRNLAILALLAAAALPARASDVDQFGFGARPISMGGAFTALATDYSGAYYNMAAPAASQKLSFAAGFSYGDYALDFKSGGTADAGQVERQQPLSAFTLGISTPISRESDNLLSHLAISFGVFLPTRVLVGAEVETAPGTPTYYLYGARRDKVSILPALSIRILPLEGPPDEGPVLAVGVGATVLADITGRFTFDLSATAARAVAVEQKLTHDVAPNFGIFFWPMQWLSFGATYRGALSLKADFDVKIVVDGTDLFPLQLEAVTLYQPQQVALGTAVDPTDWLTIAFDLTWQNWAAFQDPFVTIFPVVPQADIGFDDVFIPRIGVEVEPVSGFTLRCGYYYQASAIPAQSGPTNLIDLDKHVFSFGAGIAGDTFSLDAFFQWHMLIEERVAKDPGASAQTGDFYEAGGDVFNVGIQLTIKT
jgi:long-chain fatty acid transport protein